MINKFHTTRIAVVKKLSNENLQATINGGEPLETLKCVKTKSPKSNREYFDLIPVKADSQQELS